MQLLVSVPADDPEYDYAKLASLADGLILMTYDEHFEQGEPGPLAGQGWFEALLDRHFKGVDPAKLIVGVGLLRLRLEWSRQRQGDFRPGGVGAAGSRRVPRCASMQPR